MKRRSLRALLLSTCLVTGLLWQSLALAVPVDRAVVRFTAPELGGAGAPRFVFERELAFEARLEMLADTSNLPTEEEGYRDANVKAALERHIAETILEALPCSPAPTVREIEVRVVEARVALEQRIGGGEKLKAAADAEGLESREVYRILQRQARASIYLDRMVAPMLEPTNAELQLLHQSGRTPFSRQPYEKIVAPLRRWFVANRLRSAIVSYYEATRSRIRLEVIPDESVAARPKP